MKDNKSSITANLSLVEEVSIHKIDNNDCHDDGKQLLETADEDWMTRTIILLKRIPCAGIVIALISGTFFATASFTIKMVPRLNPIGIVVSRGIIQLMVFLPVALIKRWSFFGAPGESLFLLGRGFCCSSCLILAYTSFHMIPFSDAMTIVFATSVYVHIFAFFFLGEACGIFQTSIVTVAVMMTVLIARPEALFGETIIPDNDVMLGTRPLGILVAFLSCLTCSMDYILVRKCVKTPTAVVVNALSFMSIVLASAVLFVIWFLPSDTTGKLGEGIRLPETLEEMLWIVANGLCGALGQLTYVAAIKIEEAGLVSVARTIDIVLSFVFQVAWLPDEPVYWTSIVGSVMICACVAASAFRRYLINKPGKWNTVWLILNCGYDFRENEDP